MGHVKLVPTMIKYSFFIIVLFGFKVKVFGNLYLIFSFCPPYDYFINQYRNPIHWFVFVSICFYVESQSTNATSRCSLPGFVPTDCYNSCSELTCANLRLGEDRVCPQFCENGANCQCGGGMYRNDCNMCVSKGQCSVPCTNGTMTTVTGN